MKSEWGNAQYRYTILLTPDNNHFEALLGLERYGLIERHSQSTPLYPIYIVDRALMQRDYHRELQQIFGQGLVGLDVTHRDILNLMYRHQQFSRVKAVTAKMAAFYLWNKSASGMQDIKGFDVHYRKIRYAFNRLAKAAFIIKSTERRCFMLNSAYLTQHLL